MKNTTPEMIPFETIRIREASANDAAAVAAILNESITKRDATMILDEVSHQEMAEKITGLRAGETLLVLEEEDVIQGWGIVKYYSDRPGYARTCETSVFIRRSQTGRGLGSRLQSALLDAARKADFHHVLVRIWAANEASIAMHAKFGFTVVGTQREVGFVEGAWVDVTIMQYIIGSV